MDDLGEDPGRDATEPWILGRRWRRAFVSAMFTVVPIASFALSDGFLAPEWQDPTAEWSSIFANEARGPLEVGLLTLFGLGTAVIAWRPTARHHPLGRALLAGAAVLSGFYSVALTIASGSATIVMAISLAPLAAIASLLVYGMRALNERAIRGDISLPIRIGTAAVIAAVITVLQPLQNAVFSVAGWSVLALFGAGPLLCFTIATRLLISRWDSAGLTRFIPGAATVMAAVASIYVTWQRAMEHYATLSPTDPYADCYIASAAARGHRSVVGSWSAPASSGTVTVTNQLVHLKAVELLVRAASPRLHRWIRSGYNRVGPRLAARITSPVRADIAWATMLPLGIAARLVLSTMPAAARARVVGLHPPAAQRRPADR